MLQEFSLFGVIVTKYCKDILIRLKELARSGRIES